MLTSLDQQLTRAADEQLAARVARVAGGLRDLGVGPGDAVAWQSPNRDEVNVLYRGCWRLGALAAPLHHLMGAADVARMVEAVQPVVTVADLDALPDGEPVTGVWTDASVLGAVLFTSGSSGAPKGVLHTQASLVYKAVQMAAVHELGPDDCVLMPAPCAHISGLLNGITLPGVVPFKVVFMARWDPDGRAGSHRMRACDLHGRTADVLHLDDGCPGLHDHEGREHAVDLERRGRREPGVRRHGRAGVRRARVKRTYGSTEAPSVITDGRAIGPRRAARRPNGELLVRGAESVQGYLDPEQTKEAFTADGWYRTGDLASITDGIVEITGRLKDVIIRGGENISAAEIEAVPEAHPAVRHAVAVGEPDVRLGERVCMFVVADASFDLDTCRDWFAAQGVAKFKTPERVVVVDAFPVLATGKPDKDALRRRLLAPG